MEFNVVVITKNTNGKNKEENYYFWIEQSKCTKLWFKNFFQAFSHNKEYRKLFSNEDPIILSGENLIVPDIKPLGNH